VQGCTQCKAEDAGGLTPAKDDNAAMRAAIHLNFAAIFKSCDKPKNMPGTAPACAGVVPEPFEQKAGAAGLTGKSENLPGELCISIISRARTLC
jgi:hypothetical protein